MNFYNLNNLQYVYNPIKRTLFCSFTMVKKTDQAHTAHKAPGRKKIIKKNKTRMCMCICPRIRRDPRIPLHLKLRLYTLNRFYFSKVTLKIKIIDKKIAYIDKKLNVLKILKKLKKLKKLEAEAAVDDELVNQCSRLLQLNIDGI